LKNRMRNIKLTIAYEGTAYHGFQWQVNALSVQQVLEDRLALIFGHQIRVTGSARTDSGVHAYGQVVNLFTSGSIPIERIPWAAKGVLPADIVVCSAEEVPNNFHARYAARSKIYIYRIDDSGRLDPWLRNHVWQTRFILDVSAMNEAMQLVVGTHDFNAFRSAGSCTTDSIRQMLSAGCKRVGTNIECEFHGTGFLYHMVRNLVGTLVEVGKGHLAPADIRGILDSHSRTVVGKTAPPQGLYLLKVLYGAK